MSILIALASRLEKKSTLNYLNALVNEKDWLPGEKKNTPLLPDAVERSQSRQEVENIFNNSTYHMDLNGGTKQKQQRQNKEQF